MKSIQSIVLIQALLMWHLSIVPVYAQDKLLQDTNEIYKKGQISLRDLYSGGAGGSDEDPYAGSGQGSAPVYFGSKDFMSCQKLWGANWFTPNHVNSEAESSWGLVNIDPGDETAWGKLYKMAVEEFDKSKSEMESLSKETSGVNPQTFAANTSDPLYQKVKDAQIKIQNIYISTGARGIHLVRRQQFCGAIHIHTHPSQTTQREQMSSGDGKMICVSEGKETQDYDPCKKMLQAYDGTQLAGQGVQAYQQVDSTAKMLKERQKLIDNKNDHGQVFDSHEDLTRAKATHAAQRSTVSAASAGLLVGTYRSIPSPKEVLNRCTSIMPNETTFGYNNYNKYLTLLDKKYLETIQPIYHLLQFMKDRTPAEAKPKEQVQEQEESTEELESSTDLLKKFYHLFIISEAYAQSSAISEEDKISLASQTDIDALAEIVSKYPAHSKEAIDLIPEVRKQAVQEKIQSAQTQLSEEAQAAQESLDGANQKMKEVIAQSKANFEKEMALNQDGGSDSPGSNPIFDQEGREFLQGLRATIQNFVQPEPHCDTAFNALPNLLLNQQAKDQGKRAIAEALTKAGLDGLLSKLLNNLADDVADTGKKVDEFEPEDQLAPVETEYLTTKCQFDPTLPECRIPTYGARTGFGDNGGFNLGGGNGQNTIIDEGSPDDPSSANHFAASGTDLPVETNIGGGEAANANKNGDFEKYVSPAGVKSAFANRGGGGGGGGGGASAGTGGGGSDSKKKDQNIFKPETSGIGYGRSGGLAFGKASANDPNKGAAKGLFDKNAKDSGKDIGFRHIASVSDKHSSLFLRISNRYARTYAGGRLMKEAEAIGNGDAESPIKK